MSTYVFACVCNQHRCRLHVQCMCMLGAHFPSGVPLLFALGHWVPWMPIDPPPVALESLGFPSLWPLDQRGAQWGPRSKVRGFPMGTQGAQGQRPGATRTIQMAPKRDQNSLVKFTRLFGRHLGAVLYSFCTNWMQYG